MIGQDDPCFFALAFMANITNIMCYEMMTKDFNNKNIMEEINLLKQQNNKILELLQVLKTEGE